MKYIKRIFENTELENEPAFGEGRIEFLNGVRLDYLPAEQLKKSIDEFEDLDEVKNYIYEELKDSVEINDFEPDCKEQIDTWVVEKLAPAE